MRSAPILIGQDEDLSRVLVTIDLTLRSYSGLNRSGYTVNHEKITGDYWHLSLRGEVIPFRGKNSIAAGQILSDVRRVANFHNTVLARDVLYLWAWHLNDMRAGCVHVPEPLWEYSTGFRRPDLDATPACPVTEYRYGSQWLTEVLPPEVKYMAEQLIKRYPA